ncbi:unnamed protein product [Urochloa humidicola]
MSRCRPRRGEVALAAAAASLPTSVRPAVGSQAQPRRRGRQWRRCRAFRSHGLPGVEDGHESTPCIDPSSRGSPRRGCGLGASGGLGSCGSRGCAGPRRGGSGSGSVTVNLRAAPSLSLQITCSRRLCSPHSGCIAGVKAVLSASPRPHTS